MIAVGLSGCAGADKTKELPESFADAQSILDYLEQQNEIYVQTGKNNGDLSKEKLNVENSISRIMNSEIIAELAHEGETRVVGAIYNIESGVVEFFD